MMKQLEELRVVDLKNELEKRGLDRNGVKSVLLQRLKEAFATAGGDPEAKVKTPKLNRSANIVLQSAPEITEEHVAESADTNGLDEEQQETEEQFEEVEDPAEPFNMESEEVNGEEEAECEDEKDIISEQLEAEVEEEDEQMTAEEEAEHEDKNFEETNNQLIGENYIQNDDSINLMLEDEDKMLDYEENDRCDMDDVSASDSKADASSTGGNKDNQESSEKKAESSTKRSEDSEKAKEAAKVDKANSRNLWVSGLSSTTRAQDLKSLFSKHGKVVSAKIVTDARTPGARCYGYVTMSCVEEANKCMSSLNRTELHGKMIQVEKAKTELSGSSRPPVKLRTDNANGEERKAESSRGSRAGSDSERRDRDRARHDRAGDSRRQGGRDAGESRRPSARDRLGDRRVDDGRRRSRERKDVLSLNRIMEERERQRERNRERLMRDESRRRRSEEEHIRSIERKQREEAERLKLEREKLLMEREKVERQKLELYRMEREAQKVERQRLAKEKEELRRQQLKYEESRRGLKRPAEAQRTYYDERKRSAAAPPPPPPPTSETRSRYPVEDSRSSRYERSSSGTTHRSSYDDRRDREDKHRTSNTEHRSTDAAPTKRSRDETTELLIDPRAIAYAYRPGMGLELLGLARFYEMCKEYSRHKELILSETDDGKLQIPKENRVLMRKRAKIKQQVDKAKETGMDVTEMEGKVTEIDDALKQLHYEKYIVIIREIVNTIGPIRLSDGTVLKSPRDVAQLFVTKCFCIFNKNFDRKLEIAQTGVEDRPKAPKDVAEDLFQTLKGIQKEFMPMAEAFRNRGAPSSLQNRGSSMMMQMENNYERHPSNPAVYNTMGMQPSAPQAINHTVNRYNGTSSMHSSSSGGWQDASSNGGSYSGRGHTGSKTSSYGASTMMPAQSTSSMGRPSGDWRDTQKSGSSYGSERWPGSMQGHKSSSSSYMPSAMSHSSSMGGGMPDSAYSYRKY